MLEMSQRPRGILPQPCLPPWLLPRHQDGADGVSPWPVSTSTNEGKEASHGCRTRPRVTGRTCRSVNEVYNTPGIWVLLICPRQVTRREHVGGQLINLDIETLGS